MLAADGRPVLLEGAQVLTLDDDTPPQPHSLCIVDGTIAALGARRELRARFPDAHRVSCRNRLLMPGLVNAHLHPDLHILRGSVDGLSLHEWSGNRFFNDALELLGTADGAAFQRASIRASLAEAVLSGTTCVGAYGVTDGALHGCAEELAAFGLRGAVTARDASFSAHDGSIRAGDFEYPVYYRLHAEETLLAPELELAAAAHGRGQRLVMHAAETPLRCSIVQKNFGMSTIRLLERYGLLSPDVLLSHLTCIDADEIALLARHDARAVFSAAAEMKLGDGIPPATDVIRSGVVTALGTDAAVCSNSTDMFVEMRAFAWQQSLRYGADCLSAEQILRLATRGGAAALGLGHVTGRIAAGMAADLILLDVQDPAFQPATPWHARTSALVHSVTGAAVTDVMVAGRWIVRRRRLTMPGARRVRSDLERAARALHRRLSG